MYMSSEPGNDYVSVTNRPLVFTPNNNAPCYDVTIIDDEMVEQTEGFTVTLERSPGLISRVQIIDGRGDLVIRNNDGEEKSTSGI